MLVLIRHGSYSIRTGSLDDLGIAQAQAISELLATYAKPAAIYHSPSIRTTEMAEIIGARLGVKAQVDVTLSEQGNPSYYYPQALENTYTVSITHLPVMRDILHRWTQELGLEEATEIPIASVFVIDPKNGTIQKLSD